MNRDGYRQHLPAHPTAKHTWPRPNGVSEFAHYDELPMDASGEIYEHTDRPRHRMDESELSHRNTQQAYLARYNSRYAQRQRIHDNQAIGPFSGDELTKLTTYNWRGRR